MFRRLLYRWKVGTKSEKGYRWGETEGNLGPCLIRKSGVPETKTVKEGGDEEGGNKQSSVEFYKDKPLKRGRSEVTPRLNKIGIGIDDRL